MISYGFLRWICVLSSFFPDTISLLSSSHPQLKVLPFLDFRELLFQNSVFASFCRTSSVTRGQDSPEATKKVSSTKRSQRSQRGGFGFIPRSRIPRKTQPVDPMRGTSTTFFGISVSSCFKTLSSLAFVELLP